MNDNTMPLVKPVTEMCDLNFNQEVKITFK